MGDRLSFHILSWWHAGTGRGDGAAADALVSRTQDGLPFLPGKTVKGLVRDAVRLGVHAGIATQAQLQGWFGTDALRDEDVTPDNRIGKMEETRFATTAGSLRFESATLGSKWAAWSATHPLERESLFSRLSSTRVGADGIALDATLRVMEVAAPMTLHAPVFGLDLAGRTVLAEVLPIFIRGLGTQRNRGLGRVQVRLETIGC